jgi:hypothetical protein
MRRYALVVIAVVALAPASAQAGGAIIAAAIGGMAVGGMIAGAAAQQPVVVDTIAIERSRIFYANRFVEFYGGYGTPGGATLAYGPEIDLYWYPAYRERTFVTVPAVAAPRPRCTPVHVRVGRTWRAGRFCE